MTRISLGNFSDVEGLGSGVRIQVRLRHRLRIYFGKDGETLLVLLGGGTKSAAARYQRRSWQLSALQMEKLGDSAMPLTRDCKEIIRARAKRNPKFRTALLGEGIETMLAGDIAARKLSFGMT